MTDSERGFLLHTFHRNQGDATTLFGVGRLASGQTFAFADSRQRPAFYLRASELDRARPFCVGADAELDENTGLTTMDGEAVVRVGLRKVHQLRRLADGLHENQLRTYEADFAFARQYLVDRGIRGGVCITGSWRAGHGVDRVYVEPQLAPDDFEPALSVLALDIETPPDASAVLACSLVLWGGTEGKTVEEIHLIGPPAEDGRGVYCHATERDLLLRLAERIRQLDPDVLTGWNVVDFDLTVLQKRFAAHKLPFNLGRSSDDSWYQESEVWGASRVVVYGRQVLDAMHLARTTLTRFDDNRLGTVAQALLGRGKSLAANDDDDGSMADVILDAYHNDRAAFAEYCLEDSRLVRDILVQEDLIQLSLRRAALTGLPLERAWGSVAAFDFLYILGLRQRRMVAPTNDIDRVHLGGSPGGLVMPTRAGLYPHVFVFDFKSLYPSIIRTFNIDPLTHLLAHRLARDSTAAETAMAAESGADYVTEPGITGAFIRAPNGALFVRDAGILPEILAGFFDRRAEARAAHDDLAAYTYKIVMNSFYGVLATGSCRFAEGALAGAITGFGHYLLRWTKALLQDSDRGTVLYGDTDSLFVDAHLPADLAPADAHSAGQALCTWLNEQLATHVRELFDLPSHLDLEFEKYYARFFLPPTRGDRDKARAKGYAGLKVAADGTDEVEIIGMEAVRRDWTDLAHEIQRDLLDMVFRGQSAEALEQRVLAWVDAMRRGERDDDLVYRKALRKSVEGYTKSVPAHVAAARLLPGARGTIRYVITRDGPQPVGHVTAPIDYEHYLEKQIRPIVRTIGRVCDLDVEVALGGTPDLFRSLG
ncbi:MAG: DNA polymerase II [bacterium]|nr:DNA polymerase II [bacterium]